MVSTGLRLNPADRENGLALLGVGPRSFVWVVQLPGNHPFWPHQKGKKGNKNKVDSKVTCFRGCYVRFPGDMCFFDVFSNEIFFGPGFRLFCRKFVGSTVDLVTSKKRKVVR